MSEDLKDPIILLGNVRSGTTMIQRLFGLHPDICTWFEPRTIWVYPDPRRKHDRFDENDATERSKRYIRRRFQKFQDEHGGMRIMEKTPSNVMRIPFVRSVFPNAKFLYIVRDPLAYLSSAELKWQEAITAAKTRKRILEVPKTQLHYYAFRYIRDQVKKKLLRQKYVSIWGVRYPGIQEDLETMPIGQVIAKQWAQCSLQAEYDLADMDSSVVIRLRYEDFVVDPINNFKRILDHFQLDMTPTLEKALNDDIDPNRRSKWKRLDVTNLAACLPFIESEMKRHGYSIPDEFRSVVPQ